MHAYAYAYAAYGQRNKSQLVQRPATASTVLWQ